MVYRIENNKVNVTFSGKEYRDGIKGELYEFLSYKSPNYWHSTAYKTFKFICVNGHSYKSTDPECECPECNETYESKKRAWDGTLSYLKKDSFEIGFLQLVYEEFGGEIKAEPIPYPEEHQSDIELYDYQKEAVKSLLYNHIDFYYFPRGILKGATNSGKTYMIADIYKRTQKRTVLLVHSILLFRQHFNTLLGLGIEVDRFGDGFEEFGHFTLCMYETLLNRSTAINVKKQINQCEMLLVDECHRASSTQYVKLIKKFKSPYVYFVSGTPLDSDSDSDVMSIISMSGTILHTITNKFLIDNGYSCKIKIHIHQYNNETSELQDYGERLKFSVNRAFKIVEILEKSKNCILTVNHKSQYEFIQAHCDLVSTHSGDREKQIKLEKFEDESIDALSATMILKEGINLKNIENIIIGQGGFSKITLLQLIGRGLRKNGDKELIVHDFEDQGRILRDHFNKRIRIYQDEGFEIVYL